MALLTGAVHLLAILLLSSQTTSKGLALGSLSPELTPRQGVALPKQLTAHKLKFLFKTTYKLKTTHCPPSTKTTNIHIDEMLSKITPISNNPCI